MCYDEGAEQPRLADGPWFVACFAVAGVYGEDGDGVHGSNSDWPCRRKKVIIEVGGDGKRTGEAVVVWGRRKSWWGGIWRELEQRPGRQGNAERRTRHVH